MYPVSSVSGQYFANANAHYFAVQEICKDQVHDYARRKGEDVAIAEQWLAPILSYNT